MFHLLAIVVIDFFINIFYVVSAKGRQFREELPEKLSQLKRGLQEESTQTKEMLEIYARHTAGEASPAEIRYANKQFGDILKSVGLGIVIVLPFSPLTIPFLIRTGKKYGIDILPDSFGGEKNSKTSA